MSLVSVTVAQTVTLVVVRPVPARLISAGGCWISTSVCSGVRLMVPSVELAHALLLTPTRTRYVPHATCAFPDNVQVLQPFETTPAVNVRSGGRAGEVM